MERQIKEARKNERLVMIFSENNQVRSQQKDGADYNNVTSTYKLLPGDRLLIQKDTAVILQVDNNYLKLGSISGNRPNIVFKKIK